MSWKKEMEKNITTVEELSAYISMSDTEAQKTKQLLEQFPMSIPPYYLSLIDFNDSEDPIRKMTIPSLDELDLSGSFDTSGEAESTVLDGVQHKYSQTLMILSTNQCAMYCRHCFRKRLVGVTDTEVVKQADDICHYLTKHPEISNVLITGGDALLNENESLDILLSRLSEYPQLDTIRIASRVPVVFPQRIVEDAQLLELLNRHNKKKKLTLVTQYNHVRELTELSLKSVRLLQDLQIPVKNQTVLLSGVNDNVQTLSELLHALVSEGIHPYYLFQCRPVSGVKTRFQVPLEKAYALVQEAKNRQSGLGKSFRFCLSHHSGKLEILGMHQNQMLFQYHEARREEHLGKIVARSLEPGQTWLDEQELL